MYFLMRAMCVTTFSAAASFSVSVNSGDSGIISFAWQRSHGNRQVSVDGGAETAVPLTIVNYKASVATSRGVYFVQKPVDAASQWELRLLHTETGNSERLVVGGSPRCPCRPDRARRGKQTG
jgi:hypothetical protein